MSHDLQIMPVEPQSTSLGGIMDPTGYPQPQEERRPSLFQKLHLLLRGRYKYAIPLALVLAATGAYLGYGSKVPEYRSLGQIYISYSVKAVLSETDLTAPLPMFNSFVDTQMQLILNRRTTDMAMQSPDWQALGRGNSDPAINDFVNKLGAFPSGQILNVTYTDPDPKAAMVAVNAVIEAYMTVYKENDAASDGSRMQKLEMEQNRYTDDIKRLNLAIRAIDSEYGPEALEKAFQAKLDERISLETRYRDIEVRMALQAVTQKAHAAATNPANPAAAPRRITEEIARTDPKMRQLLAQKELAELRLRELRHKWADRHPLVWDARNALDDINESIKTMVENYKNADSLAVGNANADTQPDNLALTSLEDLARQALGVGRILEQTKREAADLGRKVQQIKLLMEQRDDAQKNLTVVVNRIKQLNIEANSTGRVTVLSNAGRPLVPFSDPRRQRAAAGGCFGFALGFGVLLLVGFLDRRVKSLADMEGSFRQSQRLLGVLPTLPDDLADPEQAAFAAHCVHRIRTMLEVSAAGAQRRVLTITSPMPGDGKTSLALSLGLSFAAADSKTLLIDCDVVGGGLTARMKAIIRRRIGEILKRQGLLTAEQLDQALAAAQKSGQRLGEVVVELGFLTQTDIDQALLLQKESAVGLLDVLDGAPLEDCITGTGTPGLWILPLGSARAHLTGQISPKAIRRIVAEARERFDVTLIDTGPLLGSLETSLVAAEADEVILAVARGEQRPLVEQAIDMLRNIDARLAGIVYNRARAEDIESSDFSPSTRLSILRSQPVDMDASAGVGSTNSASQRAVGSSRLGPVAGAVINSTMQPTDHRSSS